MQEQNASRYQPPTRRSFPPAQLADREQLKSRLDAEGPVMRYRGDGANRVTVSGVLGMRPGEGQGEE